MRAAIGGVLAFGLLLSGCHRPVAASPGPRSPGPFSGIGVFDAGRLWAEMALPRGKVDAAAAGIADDEHVIVVLDSHTGEVRQCGDNSGYCVAMNPWGGAAERASLPMKLKKHAFKLAAEDRTKATPATR